MSDRSVTVAPGAIEHREHAQRIARAAREVTEATDAWLAIAAFPAECLTDARANVVWTNGSACSGYRELAAAISAAVSADLPSLRDRAVTEAHLRMLRAQGELMRLLERARP